MELRIKLSPATLDVLTVAILLGACLADLVLPALKGLGFVVALGLCLYPVSLELCRWLADRKVRAYESISPTLAIVTMLWVYYFERNNSNFMLLALTLGVTLACLVTFLTLLSCVAERQLASVTGFLTTAGVSLVAGLCLSGNALLSGVPKGTWGPLVVVIATLSYWFGARRPGMVSEARLASERKGRNPVRTGKTTVPFAGPSVLPGGERVLDRILPLFVLGPVALGAFFVFR